MKFSPRKKAKIRKANQKKINRYCKDMIGYHIYDGNNCYEIADQAKIDDTIYLLVQVKDNRYEIWKIVKIGQYVKLSNKNVLQKCKKFSNHVYWRSHSTIQITDAGEIQSAVIGNCLRPCKD